MARASRCENEINLARRSNLQSASVVVVAFSSKLPVWPIVTWNSLYGAHIHKVAPIDRPRDKRRAEQQVTDATRSRRASLVLSCFARRHDTTSGPAARREAE